jgi:D-glycero-beta-D-manno-heptose-7-phosphate kinase
MFSSSQIDQAYAAFSKMNVLVIGDVMIDAYLWGKVDRISPEAPVPVVSMTQRESRLGGAANVALNIMAMGATPIICSVVGDDDRRAEFDELLKKRGFSTDGIVYSPERVTTVKTRIISQGHHLLRVDEEMTTELKDETAQALIDKIKALISAHKIDVIIFEDYNKGVLSSKVIKEGIPTTVDPKKDNFFEYQGVTLFKPNLKELKEGLKVEFDKSDFNALKSSITSLENELGNKFSLVTLSELGVVIKDGSKFIHIPAHSREILDVSGAGDTVISIASLCLAKGWNSQEIAAISNLAGGQVCEKVGVVPVDKAQLKSEALKL